MTIRVLFMDKAFVTSNPAAVAKVNSMGKQYTPGATCDSPATAVPECFVFDNWNGGWVGAFMHQVLKNLGVNVIAMTKANFSTAALNVNTASSFTRCVWDVRFQNVDLSGTQKPCHFYSGNRFRCIQSFYIAEFGSNHSTFLQSTIS